jgi:hypothetical protein
MRDTRCGYGDRDDQLVAYLYDDIAPGDRSSFEAHLMTCARCRDELDELRGVRERLTTWAPPQLPASAGHAVSAVGARRGWWRDIPAWAQVAAALLVLGISAAVANLNVHYGSDGITIRTGWSDVARGFSRADTPDAQLTLRATTTAAPWRDDLAALERQIRSELQASAAPRLAAVHAAPATPVSPVSPVNNDQIVRRVRALIAESERRQQRELALRIAGVVNDVNVGRAADLARIRQTLGAFENTTGAELVKQRQQMVNYLSQVSLKR